MKEVLLIRPHKYTPHGPYKGYLRLTLPVVAAYMRLKVGEVMVIDETYRAARKTVYGVLVERFGGRFKTTEFTREGKRKIAVRKIKE